jgi:hypothetical protein
MALDTLATGKKVRGTDKVPTRSQMAMYTLATGKKVRGTDKVQ